MAQAAMKYEIEVKERGRVEFNVPFPKGARVIVLVVEASPGTFNDLVHASESSLEFWDNAIDDEEWNNA
jgi:hypothetical protein